MLRASVPRMTKLAAGLSGLAALGRTRQRFAMPHVENRYFRTAKTKISAYARSSHLLHLCTGGVDKQGAQARGAAQ
jgi:hypothetical protein